MHLPALLLRVQRLGRAHAVGKVRHAARALLPIGSGGRGGLRLCARSFSGGVTALRRAPSPRAMRARAPALSAAAACRGCRAVSLGAHMRGMSADTSPPRALAASRTLPRRWSHNALRGAFPHTPVAPARLAQSAHSPRATLQARRVSLSRMAAAPARRTKARGGALPARRSCAHALQTPARPEQCCPRHGAAYCALWHASTRLGAAQTALLLQISQELAVHWPCSALRARAGCALFHLTGLCRAGGFGSASAARVSCS